MASAANTHSFAFVNDSTGTTIASFSVTPEGQVTSDDRLTYEEVTRIIADNDWTGEQAIAAFTQGWGVNGYLSIVTAGGRR